jgi:hypothetical protein
MNPVVLVALGADLETLMDARRVAGEPLGRVI